MNEQPLAEPYVRYTQAADAYGPAMQWQCAHAPGAGARPARCRPTRDNWGPLVVPAGRYFVLGDHRNASEDSRYWGFVDRAALRGSPLTVYFSIEPTASGPLRPGRVRWNRIGQPVH